MVSDLHEFLYAAVSDLIMNATPGDTDPLDVVQPLIRILADIAVSCRKPEGKATDDVVTHMSEMLRECAALSEVEDMPGYSGIEVGHG